MISVEKICYHYRGLSGYTSGCQLSDEWGENSLLSWAITVWEKVRCSNASIIFFRQIRGK